MKTKRYCLISLFVLFACTDSTREQEATEALNQALYAAQTAVDSVDLSILDPALAYYSTHDDASRRLDLWYSLGMLQYLNMDYLNAAVSLEKARDVAALTDDVHTTGMIARTMADIYNQSFNAGQDSLYLMEARDAFSRAGDSLHLSETRLRLASVFYNDHKWERADSLIHQVLATTVDTLPIHALCLQVYGSFLLDAPEMDPVSAMECFRKASEAGALFSDSRLCDVAYARYLTGNREHALRMLDSLESAHPEGLPRADFRWYCIERYEKSYQKAIHRLEKTARVQDSLLRMQASEAVSRAQRDYMEVIAQNERLEKEREQEARRAAVAWGVLGIALLVLSGVVVLGNERAKRVKDRQALADARRLSERLQEAERQHLNRIHSLERDVRKKQSTLEEVRSDYLFMFRSGYRRLGNLFEARHFAESQKQNEKVLCQKVAEILREIDGDRKGFRKLRKFIEDNLDRPISHLISDIPGLKEVDVQLFCYLVIGYDASLISLLMGIDSLNTVYSRKNRLVGRIKKLPPAKARRYLDLIA